MGTRGFFAAAGLIHFEWVLTAVAVLDRRHDGLQPKRDACCGKYAGEGIARPETDRNDGPKLVWSPVD